MKHSFATLAELYDFATAKFSKRYASGFSEGEQTYTYAQFKERCDILSGTLSSFGVNSSDKVAILSENMPNWTIAFFSISAFGRIAVPMLPELSPNEVENIMTHSGSKAIFVSPRQYRKLSQSTIDRLHLIINMEDFTLIKASDEEYTCDGEVKNPNTMDIAAIIYTSGTTGNAKGVMLSHRNLCHNVLISWHVHHVSKSDVFLSILPMAHTYEMSVGMLYPFACGARVYYLQKPPTPTILLETFKRIRPTTILSVPLIIEKIYRGSVLKTIKGSRFLRFLEKTWPSLLYFLIGGKLKKTFGGRVRFFGIGGAKLDSTVEAFLKKAHFPYAIGYGLTECAPLICCAGPKETKVGSTGKPGFGIQIKLDNISEEGDGELMAKGPNVMLGYYKDYQRTRNVLSDDGWLHTGDLAKIDGKGRAYILGRLGTMIVGASGENIYPEEIESVINNINGVNESLVIKRGGQLVALVQFNENIIDWNLEGEDKFIKDMEQRRKDIINFVNSHVNKSSTINDVEVIKEPFVKTATHKIKRFLYTKDDKKQHNKEEEK